MVRPMSETSVFIQLDDLTEAKLARVRDAAFLTVRTSPGNNQAWIAVPQFASDQDRKDFTRRVKKQVAADSSATGSVRLAGTSNFNAKYVGNFPKIAIIDAVPGARRHPKRWKPWASSLLKIPPPPWFDSKLPAIRNT
jgi:RepB DNA-primase from phage plasmid